MEVYIDGMLVKTKGDSKLISDLETVFGYVRRHNMRLNPQKCTFAVRAGKFLGFILTHRGIKPNHNKCQAILEMKSLTSMKEVQHLTGRIASLLCFPAVLAWKILPLFALLKKESIFEWMPKCEAVFIEFKEYLSSPPILYYTIIRGGLYERGLSQPLLKCLTPIWISYLKKFMKDHVATTSKERP